MDDAQGKTEEATDQVDDLEVPEQQAADVKGGRKAGKEQQEYLKVTLSDVLISS